MDSRDINELGVGENTASIHSAGEQLNIDGEDVATAFGVLKHVKTNEAEARERDYSLHEDYTTITFRRIGVTDVVH